MSGPGRSEARIGGIVGGAFRSLRADPIFVAGYFIVVTLWTLGVQWGLRQVPLPPTANANVMGLAAFVSVLVNVAVASLANGVFYQRAVRIASGAPGDLAGDVRRALELSTALLPIGMLTSAPNLVLTGYALTAGLLHGPQIPAGGAQVLVGWIVMVVNLVIILNWVMAPVAALAQRAGAVDALASSQKLISGHRWLAFGLMLLGGLIAFAAGLVLSASHYATMFRPGGAAPTSSEIAMGFSQVELASVAAMGQLSNILTLLLFCHLYLVLRHGKAGAATAEVFA